MAEYEFTDLRDWVEMNTEVGMPDDTEARIYLGELRTLLAAHGRLALPVPPLANALVGTVVEALGETYVRVRASESDGWTLGWRNTDADGWVSSTWLTKAAAVVISVPVEVA